MDFDWSISIWAPVTPTNGDSMTVPGRLFRTGGGSIVLIDDRPEDEWHGTLGKPLVWKTNSVGQTKSGNNVGFEAYQHLLLKSSLVNQDVESVFKQPNGIVVSRSDNILQKIETNVSLFHIYIGTPVWYNRLCTHCLVKLSNRLAWHLRTMPVNRF